MKTDEKFQLLIEYTIEKIQEVLNKKGVVRVAIDGRCASGKTTFADAFAEKLKCTVFHMDDFFLPPQMRTAQRLSEPGGNVHRERFLKEVLLPLKKGEKIIYKPYSCVTGSFKEPTEIIPENVIITEGSYSCHPELFDFYDLHIFLSITPEEQRARIIKRNGETTWEIFKNKWIPLEEKYFEHFKIKEKCEIVSE